MPETVQGGRPQAEGFAITLHDVIEPGQRYTPMLAEELLGIKPQKVVNAIEAGHYFRNKWGSGEHCEVEGRALLNWIEVEQVPVEFTEYARVIAERRRRRAEVDAEPEEKPQTVIEQAEDLREQRERAEREEREAQERHAWARYIAILERADDPRDGDAADLAEIMHDLGITADQAHQDRRTVGEARHWIDAYDNREKAEQDAENAASKCGIASDFFSVSPGEQKKRRDARDRTRRRRDDARQAAGELRDLARKRPQLFDGSDPPRLLA